MAKRKSSAAQQAKAEGKAGRRSVRTPALKAKPEVSKTVTRRVTRSAPGTAVRPFGGYGAGDEPEGDKGGPWRGGLPTTMPRKTASKSSIPAPRAGKRPGASLADHSSASQSAGLRSTSEGSIGSFRADQSIGFGTPATSLVATPAEEASSRASSSARRDVLIPSPKINAAVREKDLRESKWSLNRSSKRRTMAGDYDEDEEEDDSLAAHRARRLKRVEMAHALNPLPLFDLPPGGPRKRTRGTGEWDDDENMVQETDTVDPSCLVAGGFLAGPGGPRLPIGVGEMTPDPLSDDSNLTSLPDDEDLLARLDLAAHEALEGTEEGLHSSSGDEEGSMDVDAAPEPAVRRGRARRTGRGSRAEMNRKLIERWHPDVATMWEDLEASPVIRGNLIDQPIDISRELKPFQLQGLSWMMQQEQSRWKGGLLGDEMGMGKTIQAVSLIMSDFPATLPTIVVMPPVAMLQWQKEIGDYTSNKLKVLVYHGLVSRKLTVKDLRNYHVIIVSYHTLAAAHSKQTNGRMVKDKRTGSAMLVKEPSLLHSVRYHRAILDEAHSIKGRTTLTALACFALDADYRWCLSGTPLQNRIGELLSLFRFLQVRPFGTYECKSCKCSDFAWNIDKDTRQCTLCPHGTFDHISLFNLDLLTPIVTYGNTGEGREAFAKLQLLLARMMLRRVKADYSSSMELPSKDVTIRNEFFSDVERDFAMSIMRNGERQFDTYVAQGVFLNNYANIFGLIMKMRQVADHPDLILRRFAERGQNVLVCSVCDDPAEDAIRSVCHHDFCRACAKAYLSTIPQDGAVARCPRCFISLSIDLEQEERTQEELAAKNSIINRIQMDKWTSSTKIEALVHDVLKLRRSNLGKTKIIIFSQFTSMLELMEWRLRRLGIDTVMLNGSMTPEQRQAAINHFMSNASVDAFLVSLRAGGVALNLTEASHVFIIDPWWNPAAEWQSADRCHRMGQGRACTVRRIVIEDSVESRIVLLQEKKSNMISGTVNADGVALDRITPLDMQFLFRGN